MMLKKLVYFEFSINAVGLFNSDFSLAFIIISISIVFFFYYFFR